MRYDIIFPKYCFCNIFSWFTWPLCLSSLQGCLCPKKLQCFWSFPPGCQWPALSISHRFLPLFWGISAWSACQHTLSTLRCSTPTWNEGGQLKEWRRRLDRKGHLWNSTSLFFFSAELEAALDLKSTFSPTVFLRCLLMLRLFRETRLKMHLRRSVRKFLIQKLGLGAVIFVYQCVFVMLWLHTFEYYFLSLVI